MHLVGVEEEKEAPVGVGLDPTRGVGEDGVDLAAVDEIRAPALGIGGEAAREAGVGPHAAVLGIRACQVPFAPQALGEELDRRRRRRDEAFDPMLARIPRREERHVGAAGLGPDRPRIREHDGVAGERVDLRHGATIRAVGGEAVGAEGVDRDEDDVPPRRFRLHGCDDRRVGPERHERGTPVADGTRAEMKAGVLPRDGVERDADLVPARAVGALPLDGRVPERHDGAAFGLGGDLEHDGRGARDAGGRAQSVRQLEPGVLRDHDRVDDGLDARGRGWGRQHQRERRRLTGSERDLGKGERRARRAVGIAAPEEQLRRHRVEVLRPLQDARREDVAGDVLGEREGVRGLAVGGDG